MHIKPQIPREEVLKLVDFTFDKDKGWQVQHVKGDVRRSVKGDVGHVEGNVGTIEGDVTRSVWGDVKGTINGQEWQFVETPKEKLKRLIEESGDHDLLKAFNQMENN